MSDFDRRTFIKSSLIGASTATIAAFGGQLAWRYFRQDKQRVTILRAKSYEMELADLIGRGLANYPDTVARVRDGRVVLKPNLVEYNPTRPINTDPRVIYASAVAFRRAGAREVIIAEGPGHRRDSELLIEQTGLRPVMREAGASFVDLNVDETEPVALTHNINGMERIHFPKTIVHADLVVSVAKMKTHHWAGATLTMKNLFGTVPGAVYGWPKNPLHWAGIEKSIVDLWSTLRPGFGIIDGIVGMEGDGPIMGSARPAGLLVMGDHLPAVDATAARAMDLAPDRIVYLNASAHYGGTISAGRIEQIGEPIEPQPFSLVERFQHIRA